MPRHCRAGLLGERASERDRGTKRQIPCSAGDQGFRSHDPASGRTADRPTAPRNATRPGNQETNTVQCRRPRLSLARSGASGRPRDHGAQCSLSSLSTEQRACRWRAAGVSAGFVASVNQQRKCRSAATDAMAIEVKAFIRLSLSDQPFNGGGPNNLDQWEPVIRRSALIGQATEAKTYGSKAGPRICEVSLRPKRNLPMLAFLLHAQPFQNLLIAFRPLDHRSQKSILKSDQKFL